MNLRIQTYGMCGAILLHSVPDTFHTDGTSVYDALEKGFDDLMGLCDVVIDNFMVARDDWNATKKNRT